MANKLARFNPFGGVAHAHPLRRIGDFFRDMPASLRQRAHEARAIRLDVAETDHGHSVKAEVTGVKKDDIKVSIDGKQVSIRAGVKQKDEHEDESLMCSVCHRGEQYHRFSLPQEVDDTKAVAKYHDGILELTLPKKKWRPRKTARRSIDD